MASHPNTFTAVKLPFSFKKSVLATGSELKSSFAMLTGDTVFISMVFEDLKEPNILRDFKKAISDKERSLDFKPSVIGCDLHPDYISTKYAKELFERAKCLKKRIRLVDIQHHHAHIASCMAENGLQEKVIGVVFDGTGYGSDGKIWGGEFIIADYCDFDRIGHLEYVPMPGGDKAVLEPIRMAFSYLYNTYGKSINKLKLDTLRRIGKAKCSFFEDMIDKNINSPHTSSAGRLFDAISSIIGIKDYMSYEGEAAIRLEKIAAVSCDERYEFNTKRIGEKIVVEFRPMVKEIVYDMKKKKPLALISRKFHNTLAEVIEKLCIRLRRRTKLNDVVLSGGVFQNRILFWEAKKKLEEANFSVYTHSQTSCADRSLSLGQAVIAAYKTRDKKCA